MTTANRWREAQAAENEYWTGLSAATVQQILLRNASMAEILNTWVPGFPSPAIEIGIGGLGVGLLGFVPGIQVRIGVDPLPLVHPSCGEELLREIQSRRDALHFVRSSGEALPFQNACAGLVVCFNVLDHVSNAPQVVGEISRILRPGGLFFWVLTRFRISGSPSGTSGPNHAMPTKSLFVPTLTASWNVTSKSCAAQADLSW